MLSAGWIHGLVSAQIDTTNQPGVVHPNDSYSRGCDSLIGVLF